MMSRRRNHFLLFSTLSIAAAAGVGACSVSASVSESPGASDAGVDSAFADTNVPFVDANVANDGNLSFAADPLNCGAPKHSCLGGECKAGECQPVGVSEKGVFTQGPWVRNGTDVYVAGDVDNTPNALWKFAGGGGAGTSLSSTAFSTYLNQPPYLSGHETYALFSGNTLYGNYSYSDNGSLQSGLLTVDLTTGTAAKLVDTPLDPYQQSAPFAVDGTHIYWAEYSGLKRKPIAGGGGATEDLDTPDIKYPIVAMAADADSLYLAAEYDVWRYKKSDGTATAILTTLYRAWHVAVDDKMVYASDVAETSCKDIKSKGAVFAAPKNAANVDSTKKLVVGTHIISLTAGKDRAYWVDDCTGTVHATANTGADKVIYTHPNAVSVAVVAKSENAVYWALGNKLYKLAD